MKELEITRGEYKKRYRGPETIIETEETMIAYLQRWTTTEEEHEANADLFVDAGNTAQKCGLLPSELLKQRDELREENEEMEAALRGISKRLDLLLAKARKLAAIKSTEG